MTEQKNIPGHIAIILDGNGRWAKKRGRPRSFGHRAGTDATRRIVQYCGELGVRILTIYVFSSENWRRPPLEVTMLMRLLIEMVRREIRELNKNNVRLNAIGDLSLLPGKTREVLEEGIRNTSANTGLVLNLAISYGGRAEIVSAVQSIVRDCLKAKVKPANINEELVGQYLYTAGMPDPDLLIRTGGDLRISNFLLWQCAYTEFYFTPVLWPDFDRSHLDEAIDSFQRRERRFGQIMES